MTDRILESLGTAWEYIKLIGVFDVIDIVLVAFLVYHLFRFVRKGRTGQVAKAICIIIIALEEKSSRGHDFTLTRDDVQNLGMICGGACNVFFHYLPAGDPALSGADRERQDQGDVRDRGIQR